MSKRSFIDELKFIYDTPPWPNHLRVCQSRYDEAKAVLPGPHAVPNPFPSLYLGIPPFGLNICVDDTVPPNEIRFVNWKRVDGDIVPEVTRIVNIGADEETMRTED